MKKQFAMLALGFALLTTMSASYVVGQDDSMPDKKDAKPPSQTQTTPAPDKMAPGMGSGGMKTDKTKPNTATPDQSNPDKMGSGKMGSGTMGDSSTAQNHGNHKKHKKGHKMPDGTMPPDKTAQPNQ